MGVIGFTGRYAPLSNFSPHPAWYDGTRYPTGEHAFQVAKSTDPAHRAAVLAAPTARDAKALGSSRTLRLRPGWDDGLSREVMAEVVASKAYATWAVREVLVSTGTAELVELNTWHDNRWGCCTCGDRDGRHPDCRRPGANWLGLTWMELRSQLTASSAG